MRARSSLSISWKAQEEPELREDSILFNEASSLDRECSVECRCSVESA